MTELEFLKEKVKLLERIAELEMEVGQLRANPPSYPVYIPYVPTTTYPTYPLWPTQPVVTWCTSSSAEIVST